MPAERILFIRLWGLGDVLLSTPTVHAARRAFPGARIEYLTGRAGADALAGNPDIDEVIAMRTGTRPMLRALREVRRRRYDVVIDLHSTARTSYFVAVTGAAQRIGFRGRGPRRHIYTAVRPRTGGGEYSALELMRLLDLVGVPTPAEPCLDLRIAIPDHERLRTAALWRTHGLDGATVVAVSPVSLLPFKQWGAARWAEVADGIIERGGRVVVTHGPGEREQAAAMVAHMRHAPVWDLDIRSVRALAAVYERCALWTGNDSGPRHVAVAAGTPTVTVFRDTVGGPWTDPRPGQRHVYIEKPAPQGCDYRCSRCPHLGCLTAIAPDDVAQIVTGVLRGA
jgi:ADP-heptose:LPS heptosyltransferase